MSRIHWALAGPIALLLVGYGGLHDPRDWLRMAGAAGWSLVVGVVLVAIASWRRPHLVPLALIPGAVGMLLTYMGWTATLSGVTKATIAQSLVVYEDGLFEANVGRFAGGVLSAGLLFAALSGVSGRARPQEVSRVSVRLVALALLATSALAWVDAQSAHAFTAPTRAARAAEIIRWDHARTGVAIAIAITVIALLVHGVVRIRKAPRATTLVTRPALVLAGCWALLAAVDASFLARMRDTRHALWVRLAPELELDAKLAPPAMDGLPEPPVAPMIAISTDRVSVDAEPVGLADALATPTGQTVLAADLSRALGREAQGEARILVAVDAHVPWRNVRAALVVARAVGVRKVVFLFQRGPAPTLSPGDPPEAASALPRDFGGLEIEIGEDGITLSPDIPFEAAAAELRASRRLAL